jgi:hypothetical protein
MSNGRTAVGNDGSQYASSLARRSDDIFGTHLVPPAWRRTPGPSPRWTAIPSASPPPSASGADSLGLLQDGGRRRCARRSDHRHRDSALRQPRAIVMNDPSRSNQACSDAVASGTLAKHGARLQLDEVIRPARRVERDVGETV